MLLEVLDDGGHPQEDLPGCSIPSSPPRDEAAPAWVWPSATASSASTKATCRWKARPGVDPLPGRAAGAGDSEGAGLKSGAAMPRAHVSPPRAGFWWWTTSRSCSTSCATSWTRRATPWTRRDAASGRALLESDASWDAVLLDLMLPDADGLQVLRWIRERQPELAVVMITAFGTVENAVAAMKAPSTTHQAVQERRGACAGAAGRGHTRLRQENKDLKKALEERFRFEKLVGKSRAMQEVYRLVEQVAGSRATVLIHGESGTGKELVAQAIHRRSPRAGKPFLVVTQQHPHRAPGGQPLRSHPRRLHGRHQQQARPAGDGRRRDHPVRREHGGAGGPGQAPARHAGTRVPPLGALESKTVDVRILAATNEDLKTLTEQGASARTSSIG